MRLSNAQRMEMEQDNSRDMIMSSLHCCQLSTEDNRDIKAKEILKDSVFLEYIHCLCLCGHVRYYHEAVPLQGDIVSGKCENCECKGFILREDQLQLDSKDIINYFLSKKK